MPQAPLGWLLKKPLRWRPHADRPGHDS